MDCCSHFVVYYIYYVSEIRRTRMIRKFARFYKPHKKLFIIDMVCAFIVACCDLFYPVIAKNIINDYVPNQNIRLFVTWAVVLFGHLYIESDPQLHHPVLGATSSA